jgi:23S rRNA pseudouridine1911/1915/1917 synthase
MASINHPLIGDPTYGGRLNLPAGVSEEVKEVLRSFGRQALHARELTLIHPRTGDEMSWESDLPADMQALLATLAETK